MSKQFEDIAKEALGRNFGNFHTSQRLGNDEKGKVLALGEEPGVTKKVTIAKDIVYYNEPKWKAGMPFKEADGSVSEIVAYHFFEHLNTTEIIHVLLECQRVLETYGRITYGIPWYGCELASQDITHKSFWTESSFRMLFDNPYYNPCGKWKLEVIAQAIIGVVGRNLMIVGQLQKNDKER